MAESTVVEEPGRPIQNTPKRILDFNPPLINSANPWATTLSDLQTLYNSPHTGAITTRTSLLTPYPHSPKTNQYTFFSTTTNTSSASNSAEERSTVIDGETSSLNTLGYSPISLDEYLSIILSIHKSSSSSSSSSSNTIPSVQNPKPWIISVTGSASEVGKCYEKIYSFREENPTLKLFMEINLSCPNIPDKSPPAYDGLALSSYINTIRELKSSHELANGNENGIHVGIKIPPYTYFEQFKTLISTLENGVTSSPESEKTGKGKRKNPISFITATNTLGSCLVLDNDSLNPLLGSESGEGIGGMAGDAIHAIALGNVKTIRRLLDSSGLEELRRMEIIGVGGVKDGHGWRRMRRVGADVVGVGTALGREGVHVFGKIMRELEERDLI